MTKLDESRKGGAHKVPDLYSFDLDKYNSALKEGFKGSWYKKPKKFQISQTDSKISEKSTK